MGLNFFELMSKYNQFQQMLKQSNQDPRKMLDDELKRRKISPQQLQDLIQQAQQMQKLFGGK